MPEKANKIGQRLRSFGLLKFPTLAAFARALDLVPQNLTPYLNGDRLPGNKIQSRLRELGCDIEWLMTGRTSYSKDLAQNRKVAELPPGYNLPPDLSQKERRQIVRLINELSKLKEGDREKAIKVIKTIFPK